MNLESKSLLALAIVQSTAVIALVLSFGTIQALPAGSVNLDIRISPS